MSASKPASPTAKAVMALASVFADLDDDGWLDLVVANDSTPNYLYRNRGDGTFEDLSYLGGIAVNEEGRAQPPWVSPSATTIATASSIFFITTFSDDYKTLYRNDGGASFTDVSFRAGLGNPTIPFLAWGAGFLDFDNDALLDIFVANGHVYPVADRNRMGHDLGRAPAAFSQSRRYKFQEVPAATGSGLAVVIPARGAAFGDLFNDGHVDVVLNNMDAPPTLLRNVAKKRQPLADLETGWRPKSTPDAIGAKVFLTAAGVRQRADVSSGGSYASTSDPRLHFGLGSATKVDKLEIRWPSGWARNSGTGRSTAS